MERSVARKCSIGDLLAGRYVVRQGTDPNCVEGPRGEISRANLIAAVVARQGPDSLLLDDGTGRIEARAFSDEKLFAPLKAGDVVLLVARPRERDGERYLVVEIARRLASAKWLELRRAELGREPGERRSTPEPAMVKELAREQAKPAPKPAPRAPAEAVSIADSIIAIIRRLDKGQGAPVEQIIDEAGAGAEAVIENLMAEGEIFELRPGRVKVLE